MIDKLIMLIIGIVAGGILGFAVCAMMTMKLADEARAIIDQEQRKEP